MFEINKTGLKYQRIGFSRKELSIFIPTFNFLKTELFKFDFTLWKNFRRKKQIAVVDSESLQFSRNVKIFVIR
jgi:hypothetical protein